MSERQASPAGSLWFRGQGMQEAVDEWQSICAGLGEGDAWQRHSQAAPRWRTLISQGFGFPASTEACSPSDVHCGTCLWLIISFLLCRIRYHFGEFGNYSLVVKILSPSTKTVSCDLVINEGPINSYLRMSCSVFPSHSAACMSPSRASFPKSLCSHSCSAQDVSWACSSLGIKLP